MMSKEEIVKDLENLDNLTLEELKEIQKKYEKDLESLNKGKSKKEEEKTYQYPFQMYFGHQYRDVSHIFKDGISYTEKEITNLLIKHNFKEFKAASSIKYEYFENENCLFPKLSVGSRG